MLTSINSRNAYATGYPQTIVIRKNGKNDAMTSCVTDKVNILYPCRGSIRKIYPLHKRGMVRTSTPNFTYHEKSGGCKRFFNLDIQRRGFWSGTFTEERVCGKPLDMFSGFWYPFRVKKTVKRLDNGVNNGIIRGEMGKIEATLDRMRKNPENVKFADLVRICDQYFEVRQKGTSHRVYKMPWAGDPRINIQKTKGGKAKEYQVKQAIDAFDKFLIMQDLEQGG